jgi:hypothetical protein
MLRDAAFFVSRQKRPCITYFYIVMFLLLLWRAIFTWLGTCYLNSSTSLQQHFLYFGGLFKGRKCRRVKQIIWLATTWCMWRSWNNILFRRDCVNVSVLVEQIMYISWFISRVGINTSLVFSDWCNNSLNCFQST